MPQNIRTLRAKRHSLSARKNHSKCYLALFLAITMCFITFSSAEYQPKINANNIGGLENKFPTDKENTGSDSGIDSKSINNANNDNNIDNSINLDNSEQSIILAATNPPQIKGNLGFIHAFIASISVILVSELGDKTFFIAAIMAMRHPRLTIFTGAILALASMTILSAVFGMAATIIPRVYTYYISTALFAIFGLKMLKEGWYMSPTDAQEELEEVQSDLKKREDELLRSKPAKSEPNEQNKRKNSNTDDDDSQSIGSRVPLKNERQMHHRMRKPLTSHLDSDNEEAIDEKNEQRRAMLPQTSSTANAMAESSSSLNSVDAADQMSPNTSTKTQDFTNHSQSTSSLLNDTNNSIKQNALGLANNSSSSNNNTSSSYSMDLTKNRGIIAGQGNSGDNANGMELKQLGSKKRLDRDVSTMSLDEESGSIRAPIKRSSFYMASRVFMQAFTMTFLAEWGDRSQLTTIILSAREDVLGVIVGGVLGHSACTGLAVIGGRMIAQKISVRTVTLVGGVVFLLFALSALFFSPNDD